ncbi:hypothetical protein J6590_049391 [Homalodisca vitripennis]|nr:hypothetical protein J6590_049391 [Homalodisca vitripennis]
MPVVCTEFGTLNEFPHCHLSSPQNRGSIVLLLQEGRKPESYNIHVTPELSQPGCHMEPFYAFVPRMSCRVGKEVMKSASQQSVYNTSWVRTVPVSSAATIYNLLHVMSGKGDFLASVKVKDSRNCLGSPGNHSFSSNLYLFV